MSTRLEKLQEMATRKPDEAFPLYGLAMEYKTAGRHQEAAKTFQSLLEHHPTYTPAYLHYGRTMLELGEEAEAERIYRDGIQRCERANQQHAKEELQQALNELTS